ncbi:T9SS type A sorting domain-containing protein [Hymenobacter sp. BT635]|uniref:T9SS type A sorting domain-containing protein n=1 Tax=Hymenobacter nitidus TaxID=2880929 RepID=A0ABS8AH09_9BACT|nr:T9SS type A sorting domain-containing protein [Hymenobacter nitidus]MCB2378754.1 T9SS type A sorting domain-containing protein [Hymenobacter nitidus]
MALLFFLQVIGLTQARCQSFDLALLAGTSTSRANSEISSTTTDANGNIYITGRFFDSVRFGNSLLTSVGEADIFVAKLSPEGQWQWAVQAGGPDFDAAEGIALDARGMLHVAGNFHGITMQLGTVAISSFGVQSGFVGQLSSAGVWQSAIAANSLLITALAVDASGNAYVTGNFGSPLSLGTFRLNPAGGYGKDDVFVAKLSATGTWLWATRAGGEEHDISTGVALDASNNVYLTGRFYNRATFGSTILSSTTPVINQDVFVTKLSPTGTWLWAVKGGSGYSDTGLAITTDAIGSVYVTGIYDAAFAAGGAYFGTTLLPPSTNGTDIFVAKLTTDGVWQWAASAGGNYWDEPSGVALDRQGNVYVSGYFNGPARFGAYSFANQGNMDIDAFIACLTPNGAWQWALKGGGTTGIDAGTGVTIDVQGRAYLVGTLFGTTATFGTHSLVTNMRTGFVARVGSPMLSTLPGSGNVSAWAVSLYPNPATDYVTLDLPAALSARQVQATVYNAMGQLISTQTLPLPARASTLELRVAGMQPGCYMLRVQAANEVAVRRLSVY